MVSLAAINSLFLDLQEMSQFDSRILNTDASALGTRRNAPRAGHRCPASFHEEALRLRVQVGAQPGDRREGSSWYSWSEVELMWRDL